MSSLFAREAPLNGSPMTIHTPTPGLGCFAQRDSISDPALAHALAREQTDRNLRLIQPTSMLGRVVDRESTPQPTPGFLAEPFYHRLAGMRTQIVQDQMNDVGLWIADGEVQQVVGKFRRGAVARHFRKVSPGFRFDPTEHVGRTTALVLTIAPSHAPGRHRLRGANVLVQHDRLFVHAHHGFPLAQRFFVHRQDILHASDIFFIQFRHAPHFFPATASGRGFPARHGWSRVLLAAPVCVSPPLRSAGAPSSAHAPPAASRRPARRCVADPAHSARPLSPVGAVRIAPVLGRLVESVGWSAIPSSASRRCFSPPAGRFDLRPVGVGPRLATRFAPAANRSAIAGATPADPVSTAEPEIASSCPSYKLGHGIQQVSTRITIHVVMVLGTIQAADYCQSLARLFAYAYRSAYSGATRRF